jgi:hypothetical protein
MHRVARAGQGPGPWARTETRQELRRLRVLRTPHFGDLHIHTTYSGDAILLDTRAKPADTYVHAKGGVLGLPPFDVNGVATRTAQLRRPLDFAAGHRPRARASARSTSARRRARGL